MRRDRPCSAIDHNCGLSSGPALRWFSSTFVVCGEPWRDALAAFVDLSRGTCPLTSTSPHRSTPFAWGSALFARPASQFSSGDWLVGVGLAQARPCPLGVQSSFGVPGAQHRGLEQRGHPLGVLPPHRFPVKPGTCGYCGEEASPSTSDRRGPCFTDR